MAGKRIQVRVIRAPAAAGGGVQADLGEALARLQRGDLAGARAIAAAAAGREPGHFDALQLLGVIAAQHAAHDEAVSWFGRALAARRDPAAYANRATAYNRLKRHGDALADSEAAIGLDPGLAAAHFARGMALKGLQRLPEAAASLAQATTLVPDDADYWTQRGHLAFTLGDSAAACTHYARVLELQPDNAECWSNYGVALSLLGRHDEALRAYARAIALSPGLADAHANRATTHHLLHQHDRALADSEVAISLDPGLAAAHFARGMALKSLKRLQEAAAGFARATDLAPGRIDGWMQRGHIAFALGEAAAACDHYARVVELQPDHADGWSNYGVALSLVRRYDEALDAYARALALDPALADAHANRAVALSELGRHGEALAGAEAALKLDPGNPTALSNIGLSRLLNGDFAGGWAAFEGRWAVRAAEIERTSHQRLLTPENFGVPLWEGEPFDGRLLVWPEQGLGDQLLLASVIDELRARVPRLTFALDPRLHRLYARSFPGLDITTPQQALDAGGYDRQIPVVSLGRHFCASTAQVLARRRAFLRADPAQSAALRHKINAGGRLICGISWHSRLSAYGADKSLALEQLRGLFALPGLCPVDLQYGDTRAERDAFEAAGGPRIVHLDGVDAQQDIDRLAALVEACDFVVSVSNTTAHLAGALGKPAWVLLPLNTGRFWCWQAAGEDTLWYPRLRLLRQTRAGDWGDVVQRLCSAVARWQAAAAHGAAGGDSQSAT